MPTAAMTAAMALNTKTNAMPPNAPAPNAPIDGPSSRPPICAAPYSPNASPRRSRRRRVGQEAAGGRVVDRGPEAGAGAQEEERERPGQDQRQGPEQPGQRPAR